ncbi:MAG: alpha/beta hydrolase [Candidatus Bathyarchaeia archaeon]|jgi:hypothetical protein
MTENRFIENEEIKWLVDEIPVYGTLTRPKDEDSHSAMVFVAGSGPTDRDWCSPLLPGKNGSAKLLAEELATHRILTLRYDKRASGPHVRENIPKMMGKISMQSHVDELSGAAETLINRKYTTKDNLFVLTSSEGAIHTLNYQLQSKVNHFKGLILTGAPGRSIGDLGRSQIYSQIRSLPDADNIMKRYDDGIAAFVSGNPVVPDPSLPDGIKQLLLALATPANLPFARELWKYDPSEFLAKVDEPVLVVIGKKDIQVDWRVDGQALEVATHDRNNVSFVYPDNADHVLKHEERPREQLNAEVSLRYNAQDRSLDSDAVNAILNWFTGK